MTKQCPSCGGICKPSGCERENVTQTWMNSRKWQGLTEQEIKDCEKQAMVNGALPFEQRFFFARAIEAKLKEKNNAR